MEGKRSSGSDSRSFAFIRGFHGQGSGSRLAQPISCTGGTFYTLGHAGVIPIGADHAGYPLKQRLVAELASLGYEPLAHQVAGQVERGEAAPSVLLCRNPEAPSPSMAWLSSGFEGGHHARRIVKIDEEFP